MKKLMMIVLASLFFVGCVQEKEGPLEKAGKKVDQAIEKTQETADEIKEEVKDEIDDATEQQ